MKEGDLFAKLIGIREKNEFYKPVSDKDFDLKMPLEQRLIDLDALVSYGDSLIQENNGHKKVVLAIISAIEHGIIDLYKRREFGYAFCYFGIYQGIVPKLQALRKVA